MARKAHWGLAMISLALAQDPALTRGLRRQNRRDKGTIDLILTLGHAVPGTLRDWVGGPATNATAETEGEATELADLGGFPSTEAREEMFTRLGILLEQASTRPGCVERARELADEQADDATYKLGHFLAELLTEIQAGTFQGVGWLTYQAPPRRRPAGTETPAATSTETTREIAQ